jgi:hypothetical protein
MTRSKLNQYLKSLRYLVLGITIIGVSGCAALLVGGGAAGGYYVGDNYKIEKKSS